MVLVCRRLLLSKRLNTGFKDGLFGIPAGHLNPGEGVVAAAVREVVCTIHNNVRHSRIMYTV